MSLGFNSKVKLQKLAILDIETSGSSPYKDRVIEVGVVLVDGWKEVGRWNKLINPGRSLNPMISQITGISGWELLNQARFGEIADELLEVLADRVVVAHNVRFDYGFLQYEFKRLEKKWQVPHVCSVKVSRKLYPKHRRHGLDHLIRRHGLVCESRHRALGDAAVIWDFLKIAKQAWGRDRVTRVMEEVMQTPSLPIGINKKKVEKLPKVPGAYLFYDEFGKTIYVGKSVSVADRVKGHFYADLVDKKEIRIKERMADVEVIEASGELEALLIEADLIKKLQPEFNRALKRKWPMYGLSLEKNQRGYLEVGVRQVAKVEKEDFERVYGLFSSKRHVERVLEKLSKEFGLCDRWMGLDSTNKECFGYHLQRCKGACVEEESAAEYNSRVLVALEGYKIWQWPFDGAVGVWQDDGSKEQAGWLVFEDWVYRGKYGSLAEVDDQVLLDNEFDFDQYKIVKRFFNQDRSSVLIKELKSGC